MFPTRSPPALLPQVLPAATMTEDTPAADEVRVPLGTPPSGPAAGVSPSSPGAPGSSVERGSGPSASPPESPAAERGAELGASEEQPVPYPALAATVFFCLGQTTRPRSWCLRLVCSPYPSRPAVSWVRGASPSACALVRSGSLLQALGDMGQGRGAKLLGERWVGAPLGTRAGCPGSNRRVQKRRLAAGVDGEMAPTPASAGGGRGGTPTPAFGTGWGGPLTGDGRPEGSQ